MRAVRKVGPEPGLVLDELPVPTPKADEVLVRIEAASICGTDLHIRRWDQWSSERVKPPLTLGHELSGTVAAVGSSVRDFAEGDYVSAESHVTCGMCFHCRTGRAHMCERTEILGVDRDGGFADYAVVPASVVWRNDRSKLPPEIACLQEPFGNAVFATSTQELAGRAIAVLGCGPSGCSRSRSRAPSAPGASSPRTTSLTDSSSRSSSARTPSSTSARSPTCRPGSRSRTRASAWASSSRCPER